MIKVFLFVRLTSQSKKDMFHFVAKKLVSQSTQGYKSTKKLDYWHIPLFKVKCTSPILVGIEIIDKVWSIKPDNPNLKSCKQEYEFHVALSDSDLNRLWNAFSSKSFHYENHDDNGEHNIW